MASSKQTVSYLRRRFEELGFEPYSKHGQNFLIDLNLLDLIARVADVRAQDVVLEVGTGTGSLTVRLAERAAAVVTVEIDPHLAEMASEHFDAFDNVTLLRQDALRNKNTLHPAVLELVRQRMTEHNAPTFKLVANLPYSVATPIISNLLASDTCPDAMVVTIQKELAERMVAEPSTKDFGSLSVWIQCQCYAAIVRELGPSVFWPRPKVSSAIVQVVLDRQKRAEIHDLAGMHTFIRGLFRLRRKYLRSSLIGVFKSLSKSDVDEILAELAYAPDWRAEQLTVAQILQLGEKVLERSPHGLSNV